MKKFLSFMAIVAALAMTMSSCSKDEDEGDSQANRLKFTNLMMQNGTSFTWEGYEQLHRTDGASSGKTYYVVIRFVRNTKDDTQGSGNVLFFSNENKNDLQEKSAINWWFGNDMLHISLPTLGWDARYAEYRTQELTINGDNFTGRWFEKNDYYWFFTYKKSSFNEWDKYIN